MLRKEGNLPRPDTDPEVNEETIDLLELFYVLLGKWKQIAAATVARALIAAVAVVFFVTPKYQASSTIYVISRKDSAINISDLQIGSALTDDYIQVSTCGRCRNRSSQSWTCPIPMSSWTRCSRCRTPPTPGC